MNEFEETKFIGDDRPVRGDIHKWAEEKEKQRLHPGSDSNLDVEAIAEELNQKRKEELKRAYIKAIRDARASRNK